MRIDDNSVGDLLFLKPDDSHYPKGNSYSNKKLLSNKKSLKFASIENMTDRYESVNV